MTPGDDGGCENVVAAHDHVDAGDIGTGRAGHCDWYGASVVEDLCQSWPVSESKCLMGRTVLGGAAGEGGVPMC